MLTRTHFVKFVERARHLPPLPTAFVYPCDTESLQLAVSGAFTGVIAPYLVGPEARIRDVASRAALDITRMPIVDTAAEPRAAARCAVELAVVGQVRALCKGALGIDDLLAPVNASDSGLRGTRRLSHASFVDLAGWAQGLIVADAQLNITPTLAVKHDIVDNTVAFAHVLGHATPRVALIAATDIVNPALPSTGDAAALKAMGEQGIFADAYVDGPLTIDAALSGDAALASGRRSDVAAAPTC
jgi:phosphate acetyltransferase